MDAAAPIAPPARPRGGAVPLALGGIAFLCLMDALIKYAALTSAVMVVVCARYVSAIPLTGAIWWLRGAKKIDAAMLRFHALRGLVVAFAATGFFYGLTILPLAEAVTIAFIAPLLIPMFAWGLLGERPRAASIGAGAIGFGGVLIAVGGGGFGTLSGARLQGVVAVLAAAAVFALAIVMLRARAGRDGPARVNFLGTIFPALFTAPLAIATGTPPALADLPVLVGVGVLGTLGMSLYASAYARAEAQALAPLEFTALGWGAAIGWLAFAEVPRPELFAGAALIVAATLLAGRDERRARRHAAAVM